MPKKPITWEEDASLGDVHMRINNYGYPNVEKALSKNKVKFHMEEGHIEYVADTAIDVIGRRKMGLMLFERYGQWRYPSDVIRLEKAGMPWHAVSSYHGYCCNSCFHFIENVYLQQRNEKWANNFTLNQSDSLASEILNVSGGYIK